MKNFVKRKKGSVLVFSLLIMFFLLVIAMGMVSVSVIERKSSGSTAKSTNAFQKADTGAEIIINTIRNADQTNSLSAVLTLTGCPNNPTYNGTGFFVTFKKEDSSNPGSYINMACSDQVGDVAQIKSTGSHMGNTRAVEVAIAAAPVIVGHWRATNHGDQNTRYVWGDQVDASAAYFSRTDGNRRITVLVPGYYEIIANVLEYHTRSGAEARGDAYLEKVTSGGTTTRLAQSLEVGQSDGAGTYPARPYLQHNLHAIERFATGDHIEIESQGITVDNTFVYIYASPTTGSDWSQLYVRYLGN